MYDSKLAELLLLPFFSSSAGHMSVSYDGGQHTHKTYVHAQGANAI